jgi:hypothetical protein
MKRAALISSIVLVICWVVYYSLQREALFVSVAWYCTIWWAYCFSVVIKNIKNAQDYWRLFCVCFAVDIILCLLV